jgi:uncharacterized protein (TIGR03790 family)
MTVFLALLALAGCADAPAKAPPAVAEARAPLAKTDPAEARRVLLVINDSSAASKEVGEYYRLQRQIPSENVVRIQVPDRPDLQRADYERLVESPVKAKIRASKNKIDFIVLTKGTPYLVHWGSFSLDAQLACMNLDLAPISNPTPEDIKRCISPYFNKNEPFSSRRYGFYLVTRLDGYTVADAKKLVTNSLLAKPHKGPFLLDGDPSRTTNGYKIMQDALLKAIEVMEAKGFRVVKDEGNAFLGSKEPLAGYASWGSNDRRFDPAVYKSLKFLPGAIAETFVSTSARSFQQQTEGQSLVADLVAAGVTGVKGYVSEPYTFALARPEIFFDRYTSGYNLAESFAMGSLVLKWKDVVLGDPLCRPYAMK